MQSCLQILLLDIIPRPVSHSYNMINITSAQLRKAADLQEHIQSLQSELNQILGAEVPTPAETPTTDGPQKRTFSDATKARMRASQQARWATVKGTAPTTSPVTSFESAPKKRLSDQGIANIRAGVVTRMAAKGGVKLEQKPKIQRSAAWKAAISAAAKVRWAKAKRAGKSRW